MPQFDDNTGKGWTVRISYDGIRAVRDECDGLDLLRSVAPGSDMLDDLAYDDIKTIGVLWALVKGQACDVTRERFEESMPPDKAEAGFTALTEGLALFFGESERAAKVTISVTTIRETQRAETEFRKALGEQMKAVDPDKAAAMTTTVALHELQKDSTDSSGDLPDVSESIPADTVLENCG
jgi:hypothetical protein